MTDIKDWKGRPNRSTPLTEGALEDLERRMLGGGVPAGVEGRLEAVEGGQGSAAYGAPAFASGRQHRSPVWNPASRRLLAEPDTLFLLDVQDERDALEQGGRLSTVYDTYFASATEKVELSAGTADSKAIGPAVSDYDRLWIPADGLLPLDEFTCEFAFISEDEDLVDQTGSLTFFALSNDTTLSTAFAVFMQSATSMRAVIKVAGLNYFANDLVLASGDVPADTEKTFTVTFDGTNLVLRLGNAVKTSVNNTHGANPAPAMTTIPWGSTDYNAGGLVVGGGTPAASVSGPVRLTQFRLSRYARSPNVAKLYKGPTLTVDAGDTDGDFPEAVSGAMGQYAGWFDGNVADNPTSIRDQIIAAQVGDGLRTVRIDHILDRIPAITGTYPNYTYDWTHVTEPMDEMVAADPDVGFHITLGYTPSVLGANRQAVPSNNDHLAQMFSDALSHFIDDKDYTIRSISLWNEPDQASFWAGNTGQYTTMWGVVQAKLATDHPTLPLGGPEQATELVSGGTYQKATIDYAEANDRPIGALYYHEYSADLPRMRASIRALKAYAATHGFADIAVRITEWSGSIGVMGQLESSATQTSLIHRDPGGVTRSVRHAAFCFAAMHAMLEEGVDLAAHTRMGILDTSYTGIEQHLGLYTHDDPPRPLPANAAFQAWWANTGERIAAESNWPGLTAIASKSADDVISLAYGMHRPWRATDFIDVDFEWDGLPDGFLWRHYQLDRSNADQGKLVLVGSGDESNLPLGTSIGALGVGLVVVTP